MKRVLMVAFHFPPAAGSSGIQRTLRFAQYLPSLGWEPTVLSAHPRAYERTSADLLADVPESVGVTRSFALDAARHLSIAGRYPAFLGRPDRWQSWRLGAVADGLRLLREKRFDAIWSTYPIATAHQIAASLHRRSGVPWVADFRDPMAQDGYPEDPKTWRSFQKIEQHALQHAARSVFTTPGAARHYRERYPAVPSDRIVVIENGYDESTFTAAGPSHGTQPAPLDAGRITLLHSGIVYPSERDPTQCLQALGLLKAKGVLSAANFSLRFRASAHDGLIAGIAKEQGVSDLIQLLPPVPYRDALEEMLRADGLVVMQASNCNAQIPAKLYEYLRARRPILALTDPAGDTAQVLRESGVQDVAALDSAPAIAALIERFVSAQAEARGVFVASSEAVRRASRESRTEELAELLNVASRRVAAAA
ncbi:glycosyltransferase [Methylibium rhizosphaerae]|uniref:glycosyltransferase n=1 Tax=Methylibium rhizosphaerae TaxID=2570323 RepID=UPI001FE455B1|nr:glycosyltransferase [Methylibium rhizosphaerae]